MGQLVEAKEAAKATGLNLYTIYKMVSKGGMPVYRAGRAFRFDIDEFRVWMKQQAAQEIVNRQES
jgi:excisionase family DNA binding protein